MGGGEGVGRQNTLLRNNLSHLSMLPSLLPPQPRREFLLLSHETWFFSPCHYICFKGCGWGMKLRLTTSLQLCYWHISIPDQDCLNYTLGSLGYLTFPFSSTHIFGKTTDWLDLLKIICPCCNSFIYSSVINVQGASLFWKPLMAQRNKGRQH